MVLTEDWAGYAAWAGRRSIAVDPPNLEWEREYFIGVCGEDVIPAKHRVCGECDGTGRGGLSGAVRVQGLVDALPERVLSAEQARGAVQKLHAIVLGATDLASEWHATGVPPGDVVGMLRVAEAAAGALGAVQRLGSDEKILQIPEETLSSLAVVA